MAGLLLCACCRTPELVILHTNDTHSNLEPKRGGQYKGCGGALERAAFVDSVRNAHGADKVLLVHAGDFNQGSSYFTELGGSVEVGVVNAMGYDCITLGNHEFDNGIEDLTERVKRLNCKIVCANLDLRTFELGEYVKPWAVVEKGGRKIGFIGLEADLSTSVSKSISARIPVFDNVEVVNAASAELEAQGCDLVVLLSHCGYEEDQALIPQLHGIDIVIGGHTHTRVDGFVYVRDADGRKVPVITDWCHGIEMGEIKVY